MCDEFCDDIDGRYGGRLIFDRIFTEDELRLFEQLSPNDDGESFVFDDADAGFRYIYGIENKKKNKNKIKFNFFFVLNENSINF